MEKRLEQKKRIYYVNLEVNVAVETDIDLENEERDLMEDVEKLVEKALETAGYGWINSVCITDESNTIMYDYVD